MGEGRVAVGSPLTFVAGSVRPRALIFLHDDLVASALPLIPDHPRPRSEVPMTRTLSLFCLLAAMTTLADDRTMSFNTEVQVVPAPGPVVIDGQTADWDLSAGVWSYNDPTLVERYSVWTHLMWDARGVYFLARYHDPSPMQNAAAT